MPPRSDRAVLCDLLMGRIASGALPPAVRRSVARAALREGVSGAIAALHPDFADGAGPAQFATLWAFAATRRLAGALAEAGIPCLVLKGAAVAALAWPEPSQRPQTDVDLLVPPDRLDAAASALQAADLAGERVIEGIHHHHATLLPARVGEGPIELHHELTSSLPVRLEVAELLARRIVVEGPEGTGPLPALAHEDAIVQLALHAAVHALARLAWLVDVAGYASRQRLDWAVAANRARRWNVALPVLLAWEAARERLGAPIPDTALEALGVDRRRAAASRRLLEASLAAGAAARRPMAIAFRLSLLPGLAALPAQLLRRVRDEREAGGLFRR